VPARQPKSTNRITPPVPFGGRLGVSIDETASALSLNRDTVYHLIGAGRLIAAKIGRRRVVHVSTIVRLLEETIAAPSEPSITEGVSLSRRAAS
jgi:excisionase family DNA binding protein